MRRKKWKRSKSVLPLLLSAILIVEPLGTTATVYAEETDVVAVAEGAEPSEGGSEAADSVVQDEGQETENDSGNQEEESAGSEDTEKKEDAPADQEEQEDEKPLDTDEQGKEISEGDKETESDVTDKNTGEDETSEEDSSVSENEVEQDSVSENDTVAETEKEQVSDLGEFSDMPAGYQLNAAQLAEKQILAGEVENINAGEEGVLYVTGQIMVEAGSQKEAEMIAEAFNAEIKGFENGILLLKLRDGNTVASAVKAAASARTRLPAVWPNYYRYPHTEQNSDSISIEETEYEIENNGDAADVNEDGVPTLEAYADAAFSYNDPALLSENANYQWQHVAVGSAYAWADGYTGAGIKVAILDTGVKNNHEDLTLAGEANATGNTVTTGAGTAADVNGHGTHVAGIVGAKANNGKGGVGIAPDATLYAVNVLSGGVNAGTDWAIVQGIKQAQNWNVDIINMSLGGPGYNELCQKVVSDAYDAGIAIFVSAGNEGVNRMNYPACYDKVICVAAVDQGFSRADFSTYGSWVDLCAPGVGIWSSYNDGTYCSMDGTSQASPVAAGEAAVILAGDDSLKNMAKNGAKVDALEKKMKSNVVKASGSGIGAGVTSLTKVFNLSTAAVKPQAPTISIVPDDASKAQKVTVTITAQGGMDIYYTDNGKNPVYKDGKADTNTKKYSRAFSISNAAKGAIKAIAVNESGVASPVKSVNFTLKPYVSSITISGVEKIAAGKSVQLAVEVLPAYATNKAVEWKLYTEAGVEATAAKDKISISASGKVTAKTGVTVGAQYKVRATAKDGSGKYDEFAITVINNVKIKTVKFDKKSLTLEIPKTSDPDCDLSRIFQAELSDGAAAAVTDFKWSSSNKSIATVDASGVIQPLKAGKVTITALANDSSGKKATCAVTIKQLATSIQITGTSAVAAGKSASYKATIAPADVSVKKVVWSVIDKSTNAEPAASTGVTINKNNGKLSTKATSKGSYTVKATAADNSGVVATKEVTLCEGSIKALTFKNNADKKVTIFRRAINTATKTSAVVAVKIEGTNAQANLDAFEVINSNPGVATVSFSRTGDTISLTVSATGRAAGKTNVTIAAADGSNKKVTCAVTVNNPVTKVHISSATKTNSSYSSNGTHIDMLVVKGKSIQLKATLESEYGAISNKGVNWYISDIPSEHGITMNKSGKISAKKNAKDCLFMVMAEAADGSGAKDTYVVATANPATKLSVPALVPVPGTIKVIGGSDVPDDEYGSQQFLALPIDTDVMGGYIEATSSNKKAMDVLAHYDESTGRDVLLISPHPVKKDTMVTITVKVTDGSNKKATYKVKVLKD